jgi:acyl-CoA synthetase (AMP-forming)/AMP-acid ligase II
VTGAIPAGALHGVIDGAAIRHPDRIALVAPDGTTTTFAALAQRVARTASVVAGAVPPGGVVAAIGPNHPGWVDTYYGVPAAGRVLLMLNHRLAPAELAAQVGRAGTDLVVGEAGHLAALVTAGVDPAATMDWASLAAATNAPDGPPGGGPPVVDAPGGGSPAWLLFTSGTTGTPKGVVLTHGSVLAAVAASAGARPVDDDDVYLFCFPLCHVAGYNVVHRHAHLRPVVLMEGFDAAGFCRAVADHGVTSCSLAATMLSALCDHLDANPGDTALLGTLRVVAYGAAPMPPALLRRAHGLLGVDFTQGYGMTELSGNAVFLDAAAHRRGLEGDASLLSAAGWPAPGVELRITGEDGTVVPPGERGEIEVRAAQVMAGYLDDPVATAATVRHGWLRTGDIGTVDGTGLLRVVDRSKDIIITGGENVASREVEEAVLAAPGVGAVAVVGVPDERWGENVCAVVVPAAGAVIDPDAVVAHVRGRLAGFKSPRHVVVVDALPTNAAGKVAKADLRAWLADNPEVVGPRR